MRKIDLSVLRAKVNKAATDWLGQLRKENPKEAFYGFALYTDNEAGSIHFMANGEDGLRRTKANDRSSAIEDLRWDVADWFYSEFDLDHSDAAQKKIETWSLDDEDLDDEAFERMRDAIFEAFVLGLQDADKQGVFGTGAARSRFTVFIWIGDPADDDLIPNWAKRLNPEPAYRAYADWLAKWS